MLVSPKSTHSAVGAAGVVVLGIGAAEHHWLRAVPAGVDEVALAAAAAGGRAAAHGSSAVSTARRFAHLPLALVGAGGAGGAGGADAAAGAEREAEAEAAAEAEVETMAAHQAEAQEEFATAFRPQGSDCGLFAPVR